jgi:glutaconate CoA-transferase subunit A
VAEIVSLAEAINAAVHDGDIVAMEGFTHLIPHAAGHEVIRQRRRDLTLVRMTPDVIYDQMIGAGCARKLVFSWAGNPGVGSLHRFRDAVEHSWPGPLEIEEHSHAGMANRYQAGASGLPFAILRGYRGTSLTRQTTGVAEIVCPFTGETLTAVAALRPDVAVIHAQRADPDGNVQYWGITGVQKEVVLAATRSVVTVEEIVDVLEPRPGAVVLPSWAIGHVALAPGGAHPSYALGYSERDNDFYVAWDAISRDRLKFQAWLGEHVYRNGGRAENAGASQEVREPRETAEPRETGESREAATVAGAEAWTEAGAETGAEAEAGAIAGVGGQR